MNIQRRTLVAGASGLAASAAFVGAASVITPAFAQRRKLRFGAGPLLPTPADTKKAYDPVFAHLAKALGAAEYDLVATTDWAGMAVAMGSGQLDVAWMGPWGYVLARAASGCAPVATVKYDDKPIYHAIIVARPDLKVAKFPDDTRGLRMSFADVGSTSGWLIPSFYAKDVWKIDPKTYWKYTEGATHAANEIAVQAGQTDMATDFDRNRNAMIANGTLKADSTKIIWTSSPLPNDAIVLPKNAPAGMAQQVQKALTSLTAAQAKALLPNRYTGFVAADHSAYLAIENAGVTLGKVKKS